VAIDGSKFKAVNSSDRNFTQAKLKRRMEEIEANVSRYLAELDTADRQEPAVKQARSARMNDKIAAMKLQMAALKEIEAKLEATGETQISLTDPDARSMMTRGLRHRWLQRANRSRRQAPFDRRTRGDQYR